MKRYMGIVFAVSTLAAGSASAAEYSISGLAQSRMTYTTAAAAAAAITSEYSGVGSLFVSFASTATTGFGGLCTGSLLNSTTVLTAAHCLYDYDQTGAYDPVTAISFFLPSYGSAILGNYEAFDAVDHAYNPLYDNADHSGDIGSGHDVALFTLGTEAIGYDTYEIYTDDPLKQFTMVGAGTIGGPKGTGIGTTDDYLKRTGSNLYELYGDDVFSDVSHGVVLADFDDGTTNHDVFGRNQGSLGLTGLRQRGITGEANSSPGDSGGPSFIDGKIAAVTSFGITGGIFQGYCGSNSTDPYNVNGGSGLTVNLSRCTNSSVGEIMGNTLTSYNSAFISQYIADHAAAVPEPATWAAMIIGFALVGGSMRRRSRASIAFI